MAMNDYTDRDDLIRRIEELERAVRYYPPLYPPGYAPPPTVPYPPTVPDPYPWMPPVNPWMWPNGVIYCTVAH